MNFDIQVCIWFKRKKKEKKTKNILEISNILEMSRIFMKVYNCKYNNTE